jgi:hypothetical protein
VVGVRRAHLLDGLVALRLGRGDLPRHPVAVRFLGRANIGRVSLLPLLGDALMLAEVRTSLRRLLVTERPVLVDAGDTLLVRLRGRNFGETRLVGRASQ